MIKKYGKVFNDHSEVIKFLQQKENKADVIRCKKAADKNTDAFGFDNFQNKLAKDFSHKAASSDGSNDTEDIIYRTIVGNTYKYMDSHDDVHIPGIFTKTLQENQGNILHVHDHIFEVGAKVGVFSKVYEEPIDWVTLGLNRLGQTVALLADSQIRKALNASIFDQYKNDELNQHSVAMRYVNMFLCINDPNDQEHYANWNKYFVDLGNMPLILEQGYFWAITEAKLKEISPVTNGSNDLTPTLPVGKQQPSPDTATPEKKEPSPDTQPKFINPNNF